MNNWRGFQWIVTGRFSQARATVTGPASSKDTWEVRYDSIWPDVTSEPYYAVVTTQFLEEKRDQYACSY